MLDTRFLRGSDGTGNAVSARVNTTRIAGATVLKVDSVTKWPTQAFIATVGALNASGYLDPTLAPITEFRGHIVAGDIIIDSYEPGYSDVGNDVNQYVILKQTTGWANLVNDSISELQTEIVTRTTHTSVDFVQTGGIWTSISGLNAAMTAVTAYQAGLRTTLTAVASRAFTASKDTYIDILRGGTTFAPTFSLVYTEATLNAASPTLAANSIRIAIVTTNGSTITGINQGSPLATTPAPNSIPMAVCDSLGNLIYPKQNQKLIGYRQWPVSVGPSSSSTSFVELSTSFNIPVLASNVPNGSNIKATLTARGFNSSTGTADVAIFNGALVGNPMANASAQTPIVPLNITGATQISVNSTIKPAYLTTAGSVGVQAYFGSLVHMVELD